MRGKVKRGRQKKADYLLRHTRDFPIAVVEAKADYKKPGDGLSQAKDYAQILDLKFAYSTNGTGIVEFDFLTGRESTRAAFPTPDELWARIASANSLSETRSGQLLEGFNLQSGKVPRYYQEVAINRVVGRGVAKQALEIAQAQGRFTIFALVDALTRLSGEISNAGDRTDADEKAGALLALAI